MTRYQMVATSSVGVAEWVRMAKYQQLQHPAELYWKAASLIVYWLCCCYIVTVTVELYVLPEAEIAFR